MLKRSASSSAYRPVLFARIPVMAAASAGKPLPPSPAPAGAYCTFPTVTPAPESWSVPDTPPAKLIWVTAGTTPPVAPAPTTNRYGSAVEPSPMRPTTMSLRTGSTVPWAWIAAWRKGRRPWYVVGVVPP